MATQYLQIPASALGKGFSVNYRIKTPSGEIWTTGTVMKIRRIGPRTVKVALKHRKTGKIHVNRLSVTDTVYLFASFLQPGYVEQMAADPLAEMFGGAEACKELVDSMTRQLQEQLKSNMTAFFAAPIER